MANTIDQFVRTDDRPVCRTGSFMCPGGDACWCGRTDLDGLRASAPATSQVWTDDRSDAPDDRCRVCQARRDQHIGRIRRGRIAACPNFRS